MKRIFLLVLIIATMLSAQLAVGEKGPGFYLRATDNTAFFLSKHVGPKAKVQLKGPVVLSFFATWCIPCRIEIPVLIDFQKEFPDVKFYMVNVSEKKSLVKEYITKMNITLPVLLDQYGVVGKNYGAIDDKDVAHLPTLIVLDSEGMVIYSHQGFKSGDEVPLKAILETL